MGSLTRVAPPLTCSHLVLNGERSAFTAVSISNDTNAPTAATHRHGRMRRKTRHVSPAPRTPLVAFRLFTPTGRRSTGLLLRGVAASDIRICCPSSLDLLKPHPVCNVMPTFGIEIQHFDCSTVYFLHAGTCLFSHRLYLSRLDYIILNLL